MSDYQFQVDLLGKLIIEEIYLYYEEPLMFSCKNLFGHIFLVNCIDLDEENKTWLMLPITSQKLKYVKKGIVSVYDAFVGPEDKYLWKVIKKPLESICKATQIIPTDLTPNDLPTKTAYIEFEESEIEDEKRHNLAREENRALFDVSLEINQSHSTEISPEVLSKTVMEIQNTIYSIAHYSGSINSAFPKSVLEDNQLSIVGTYAASFGIRFMSKQLCDIFGDIDVSKSIEIFMQLLESKDDSEKIREVLSALNPKVGIHYKKVLSVLVKNNTGLKTYFATPNRAVKEVFLSLLDIKQSLNALESEIDNTSKQLPYSGKLVGVNVENKTFSFIPHDEKRIEGKLSTDVNAERFTVPLDVDVIIEERILINQLTRKEQIEYTLISIKE
jgi:hypothetical protein